MGNQFRAIKDILNILDPDIIFNVNYLSAKKWL